MATQAEMDALHARLLDADTDRDPDTLAKVAWELYGLLGTTAAEAYQLRARLVPAFPSARPARAPAARARTANAPR